MENAQEQNPACGYAKHLLTTGKPPPKAAVKTTGDYFNEVRFYCREASLSPEGILVVKMPANVLTENIERERIIVLKPLLQSLLWYLCNHD